MTLLREELTGKIIQAYYKVYNKLGYGFLEGVYENAMMIELKKMGLKATKQQAISVYYEEQVVGDFFADIVVQNAVILELKAVSELTTIHEAQLLNYLKATDMEVGLLMNFGPKPAFKRRIFENRNK